jgi:signal transduction histidine kinase
VDELGLLGLSLNAMADRVARVLQAQKDLLAGVSHELRSPLARIEVALELIRIELVAGRDQAPQGLERRRESPGEQLLGEIHEEVVLLERHIQRLLEAQRVGVDRVLVVRKPLSLDDLVQTVVRRETHRLELLGFGLEVVLDSGHAVLNGDENALDRVLSTLVENAVQHAGEGEAADGRKVERALRIETARDELHAIVRVHDRGPGLTPEQCTRVFEAFYRTDRSRDAKTGGTGLGLYLVKGIAEGHGGTARAMPREGGGLTIELRLPVHGQREQRETVRMQVAKG